MKHLSCLIILFASMLAPAPHAQAQASIYGSAALMNFVFADNGSSSAKSDTGGLIGGVFYNFPIQSRLTAGLDARVSYGFSRRGGTTATIDFRLGIVPTHVILRPYFQIGGGIVTSTPLPGQLSSPIVNGVATSSARVTNGAVEILAGLDIRLSDSFDLRAIEIGAAASGSNASTVGSAFGDAGLIYHFHKRP